MTLCTRLDPSLPCDAELWAVLGPHLAQRSYGPGDALWRQGDATGRLVVIDAGRVKAVRTTADGRSLLLYVFGPGDVFGFLPFLDGDAYPASAIALDPVRARTLDRAQLQAAIAANPRVALVLLGALAARLRQAFQRAEDHVGLHADAQVAAAVLMLAPAQPSLPLVVPLPRPLRVFADDLGIAPETFSRAISRLAAAAVVHRLGGSRLQVLDLPRLRAIASGAAALGRPRDSDRR